MGIKLQKHPSVIWKLCNRYCVIMCCSGCVLGERSSSGGAGGSGEGAGTLTRGPSSPLSAVLNVVSVSSSMPGGLALACSLAAVAKGSNSSSVAAAAAPGAHDLAMPGADLAGTRSKPLYSSNGRVPSSMLSMEPCRRRLDSLQASSQHWACLYRISQVNQWAWRANSLCPQSLPLCTATNQRT